MAIWLTCGIFSEFPGTAWGVWDGLHRILPAWVFSGGGVALGGEVVFAALAFLAVKDTLDKDIVEEVETNGVMPTEVLSTTSKPSLDSQLESTPETQNDIDVSDVLAEVEMALQAADEAIVGTSKDENELFQRKLLEARISYENYMRTSATGLI